MARRTATNPETEQDTRLGILNTLLTTPHGEADKLDALHPMHAEMVRQDPLFYVHLAAWYNATGEIRDHKEMFIATLCLSTFEGHRDVGLAMLRELPPYQVIRVIDFIKGGQRKVSIESGTKMVGKGRNRRIAKKYISKTEKFGLNHKRVPRSMRTEITRYLREREDDTTWFDGCVLAARKHMRRMYKRLQLKPSERAQSILFEDNPPDDSKLAAVKALQGASTPAEQAEAIVENKIPYRIASSIVTAMTPSVIVALIEVMSPQELINNLGSLKKRGAFDNPDIKKLIQKKLETAKTGKRVAAMKTTEAIKAADVDEETQKQLEEIADTQVKSKGRIKRPTALLIDKSHTMTQAIEIGKRIAALISAIMDDDLFVYAFDSMPYPITSAGDDLASWEKTFAGIIGGGMTSCGVGVAALIKQEQRVEQIIMITDEKENTHPAFVESLKKYGEKFGMPNVVLVKCASPIDKLERQMQEAMIAFDAYEFDGDYYSIPNIIPLLTQASRLDLLMSIMSYSLPERKVAQATMVA